MNTLVVYSTTDGHTRKIAERLAHSLETKGERVRVVAIGEAHALDLARYGKIVLGASVRYGVHGKAVDAFVAKHLTVLNARPNAFFSVNLVARKPEKRRPEANQYLQKFLKSVAWRPRALAVFAGKLDYPRYRWLDRIAIQLIMKMTKGPTDPTVVIEYTDWEDVERFAQHVHDAP
jgi:menaquinone-dependent protoporphyrinogen oxidase